MYYSLKVKLTVKCMLLRINEIQGFHARQIDKQKTDIFAYLMQHAPQSRKDITRNLRLRSTTVSNMVQELIADGLLIEGRSKNSGRPGRPDLSLWPVSERLVAATIYIEDHKFIGSLVDIAGRVLLSVTIEVPSEGTNEDINAGLTRILEHLKGAVPLGSEFLGVGISVVGTVDSENCVWVNADRWPQMHELNIGDFARRNGVEVILKRNLDVELEYILENNPQWRKENLVLFHWGFGIGGAYSYQGRILDSPLGRYMDIGHTIIYPKSKKRCRCGGFGCVESEAAIYALLPTFRKRFPNIKEDSEDIDKVLADPHIFNIPGIKHAVDTVGLCLSNLFKIFYPHRILLVGTFVRNVKIVERLEKIILGTFYAKLREKVGKVDLVVIPDSFKGCTWANAYPFFRKRLQELLTAKR
jgi:predicted NBD/HSP70 family sugar kinase